MKLAFILLALVVAALAVDPPRPDLSEDFTADVEIQEGRNGTRNRITGTVYMSYTNKLMVILVLFF